MLSASICDKISNAISGIIVLIVMFMGKRLNIYDKDVFDRKTAPTGDQASLSSVQSGSSVMTRFEPCIYMNQTGTCYTYPKTLTYTKHVHVACFAGTYLAINNCVRSIFFSWTKTYIVLFIFIIPVPWIAVYSLWYIWKKNSYIISA